MINKWSTTSTNKLVFPVIHACFNLCYIWISHPYSMTCTVECILSTPKSIDCIHSTVQSWNVYIPQFVHWMYTFHGFSHWMYTFHSYLHSMQHIYVCIIHLRSWTQDFFSELRWFLSTLKAIVWKRAFHTYEKTISFWAHATLRLHVKGNWNSTTVSHVKSVCVVPKFSSEWYFCKYTWHLHLIYTPALSWMDNDPTNDYVILFCLFFCRDSILSSWLYRLSTVSNSRQIPSMRFYKLCMWWQWWLSW